MGADILRTGGGRLRVGPWHGDTRVAYVAPVPDGHVPSADALVRTCHDLASQGYAEVLTAALGPLEARTFLEAGFEVHERLHLLARELRDLPSKPEVALRRARGVDRPGVLAVDARSFPEFWRLDAAGLHEALTATPSCRFRVADTTSKPSQVAGYAVTGRAGKRGYLQRLAVDPAEQGRGLGAALVLDGLGWLRRRGVERVVVNTQEANASALALYERLGFRRQPAGLAVLRATLS